MEPSTGSQTRRVVALGVEVKFRIPDDRMIRRLLSATALTGFSLEAARAAEPHDPYLDSVDGAFRARGSVCRIRWQDSRPLATLKGLGAMSGATHHRTERQVKLRETFSPRDSAQSAARDLALHLGIRPMQITPFWEMRQ